MAIKQKVLKLPTDYHLVEDSSHVILPGDRYNLGSWHEVILRTWGKVSRDFKNMSGRTIKEVREMCPEYKPITVITYRDTPRFKTEKCYPFGY